MSCLLQGIDKYKCNEIKTPVEGENLAPWVRCQISGSGFNITVGNESDPDNNNNAVIKSFQFGTSTGAQATLEILDEEGGNFEKFMSKLNADIKTATADYKMVVTWGWVNSECQSPADLPQSQKFYFLPMDVVARYSEGKIHFTITGGNLMEVVFETRQNKSYGREGGLIPIKEAIRQLFSDGEPIITNIEYKKISPSGEVVDWVFDNSLGGEEGPPGIWPAHQQNKLDVAYRWLKAFTTSDQKGIKASWDPSSANPTLIFWEDPNPKCYENIDFCSRSLGTYIVNGGACSPVISFTPSAKWVYQYVGKVGGGTGGIGTGKTVSVSGRPGCDIGEDHSTGTQNSQPLSMPALNIHGPDQWAEMETIAVIANANANKRMYTLEGELRIQGDPKLAGQKATFGRSVSIVVVNPFNLTKSSGGNCSDWLAKPNINPVFSNKGWMIKGIDHYIGMGQYVTTIKVYLAAPGSDIESEANWGGNDGGFNQKQAASG